uniref:Uncharacterized protein LOC104265996 n=1 Tax=Phallusia mammillata TaxID=59560 RepID=A0A6F9DIA3_9ASCI|nr:uncharacterized protein LOC104265996 [Phallusia mammillata]
MEKIVRILPKETKIIVVTSSYLDEFDFITSNKIQKWFQSRESAKRSIQKFEDTFGVKLHLPLRTTHDIDKMKVYWNNETDVPYIMVHSDCWRPVSPEEVADHSFVITMVEVITFPTLKNNSKFRRWVVGKHIKEQISTGKLTQQTAFYVNFLRVQNKKTPPTEVPGQINKIDQSNIKWVSTVEEARKAVDEFEILTLTKFIVGTKKCYDISKGSIHWDNLVPYVIKQSSWLHCQHGIDRIKKPKEKQESLIFEQLLDHPYPANQMFNNGTKKVNCRAKIRIQEILRFPQFKAYTNSQYEIKKIAASIHKALKDKDLRETLRMEWACSVTFPSNDDHSGHVLGESAGLIQKVDKRIIAKIYEMVNFGICNVVEVINGVESFVVHELFRDMELPSRTNRRFFPPSKVVHNHFYKAITKRRLAASTNSLVLECIKSAAITHEDAPRPATICKFNDQLDDIKTMSFHVTSQKALKQGIKDLQAIKDNLEKTCNSDTELKIAPSSQHKLVGTKRRVSLPKSSDELAIKRLKMNTVKNSFVGLAGLIQKKNTDDHT